MIFSAAPCLRSITADNLFYFRPGFGDDLCGLEHLAAGRGDILYQQNDIAGLQHALDHFAGAVAFFTVADDDPVLAGLHRRCRSQRHAAEFRTGYQSDVLCDMFGEFFAQSPEYVRTGLEQILVEIVFASFAAAKDKVAFQISRFLDAFYKFLFGH